MNSFTTMPFQKDFFGSVKRSATGDENDTSHQSLLSKRTQRPTNARLVVATPRVFVSPLFAVIKQTIQSSVMIGNASFCVSNLAPSYIRFFCAPFHQGFQNFAGPYNYYIQTLRCQVEKRQNFPLFSFAIQRNCIKKICCP